MITNSDSAFRLSLEPCFVTIINRPHGRSVFGSRQLYRTASTRREPGVANPNTRCASMYSRADALIFSIVFRGCETKADSESRPCRAIASAAFLPLPPAFHSSYVMPSGSLLHRSASSVSKHSTAAITAHRQLQISVYFAFGAAPKKKASHCCGTCDAPTGIGFLIMPLRLSVFRLLERLRAALQRRLWIPCGGFLPSRNQAARHSRAA